ncbi:hypothetical protein [Streptomyces abyssomicinicus]|uniref:hypothetical protein n=1 Tax=Streptomyces abyssomicinicus TaxID=574929 RepID=UPI00125009BD|nr:hypothetical protein [Streptomyces abyssomicinicus]
MTSPSSPSSSDDPRPPADRLTERQRAAEKRRIARETRNERIMWWNLAYFLFGIHIVAAVMIFAISHAK